MAKTNGWIKLHRQIQETKLWNRDEPFDMRSAWVDLIMMVNYEDQKFLLNKRVITIKRGQTFTSVRKLSKRWGWGVKRTMAYLKILEDLEMATVKATTEGTLITLVNYEVYQGDGNTNDNTNGHTTDNTTDNTTDTQYKNNKKYKEKNKSKISTFGNFTQRDTEEDDIYTILSRKGNKG